MTDKNTQSASTAKESSQSVQIRRAPRFFRFMVIGAILGLILALIFWFSISPDQRTGQPIFGYLVVFITALGFGFGALAAVLVDRAFSARATTAEATKLNK
jgi:hypothetical protein